MANHVKKPFPCTFCGNDEFSTSREKLFDIRQAAWLCGWKLVTRKKAILGMICPRCIIAGKTSQDLISLISKL